MKNLDTTTTQFLLIASGEHHFALPAACVQKILSPLPVTPIPFVPTCIDGLVNIDGTIAIQVSLATLCHHDAHTGRTELILVETGRALCALLVERIVARTELTTQDLLPTDTAPIDSTLLAGTASYQNQPVYWLAPERIGQLIQTSPLREGSTSALGKMSDTYRADDEATIACLAVAIGADQYAFELQSVIEILEADSYTPIPDAPAGLLGFSLLRQQTIPVIALANLVDATATATAEAAWLLVVEREGAQYGLLVNQLHGVKKFPFESFQPVIDSGQCISGIFIHEDTTTLLLSPRQIINDTMAQFLAPYVTQNRLNAASEKEATGSFLRVTLCQKTFIIPLHNVKRIVPFFPMNPLDDKTDTVCGAINIEGKVIPVLALEKMLKMTPQHSNNEYVIVGDATHDWAICVEAAQHIVHIPLSHIHSETALDTRALSGIARVNDELIPLLNPTMFSQQRLATALENTP